MYILKLWHKLSPNLFQHFAIFSPNKVWSSHKPLNVFTAHILNTQTHNLYCTIPAIKKNKLFIISRAKDLNLFVVIVTRLMVRLPIRVAHSECNKRSKAI